jgi:hypothetical protein
MDRMGKNLIGLERAQEEFHQAFDNRMEDVEEEMQVAKTDINVLRIWMLSTEGDVDVVKQGFWDVEMSVDNSHLSLEKVEDRVDGFVNSLQRYSQTCLANTCLLGPKVQRVQREWRTGQENLLLKFSTNNNIIDKMFVRLDEELERVVDLVGQKIDVKFGEFSANFLEAMEIEENQRKDLEVKVATLEEWLQDTVMLLSSLNNRVMELEDTVMEEADAEGEEARSSSLSDFGPVENMVAIPVPTPSVIHTLIPIPDTYIPPSVRSSPSPLYVQALEEDLVHSGVPEYWADLEAVPDSE